MGHEHARQRGPTAVRLTFTSEEGTLELVDARRARMRVPAGERVDEDDERIGNWVEVRNDEGDILYRRRIRPVAPETVGVPRVGGGFERVPSQVLRVVSVLVPDVEGAQQVLLRERRPRRPSEGERAKLEMVDHASVSLDAVDELDGHDTHEDGGGDDSTDDTDHHGDDIDDHDDDGSRTTGAS